MGSSKHISQEIKMYLVSVDHNDIAAHLTRSDWWVLRSGVYLMQWIRLMVKCGMTVKRMGMLGASVREMEVLTVKMETVTVTDW